MSNFNVWAVAAAVCVSLVPQGALAFGKKRPKEPPETLAYPIRLISMGQLTDSKFVLPDGQTQVNLAVELPNLILVEATQAQKKLRFKAPAADVGSSSGARFVLRGGLTAFEASNVEFGVKVGFRPGAGNISSGILTGAEGELKYTIGTLDMNFYIVDTMRDNEVVAVGHGTGLPQGGAATVALDFGVIHTAFDFVYHRAMYPVFTSAVRKAFQQMVDDPSTNRFMDWSAQVSGVNLDLKEILFNAGLRDGIENKNVFSVYDNHGVRLGEVKVVDALQDSSKAIAKDNALLGSVRAGDTVKVFFDSTKK